MSELLNDFTFSFSSWKTFRACPRRWWLSKVLFWGGWERGCKPEVRLAYVLTKMQTFFSLAGSIVHDLAHDFAKAPRGRGARQLADAFAARFLEAEGQSLSGEWGNKPNKAANIFEHYYRHPDAARIRERALARGVATAAALADSPAIRRARAGRVLQAEVLEKFSVAGIPVWVQIDLVTAVENLVYLGDYKTGRRKPEHRAQGLLYALYAHDAREVSAERIRVALDYLHERCEDVLQPEEADIDELRAAIIAAATTMTERLQQPADGEPLLVIGVEADFPGVDDPDVCADCQMFHVCKGSRDIPWPTRAGAA